MNYISLSVSTRLDDMNAYRSYSNPSNVKSNLLDVYYLLINSLDSPCIMSDFTLEFTVV